MLELGRRGTLLGGLATMLPEAARAEAASPPDAGPHAPFRAALLSFLNSDAARRCRFPLSADASAPGVTTLHVAGVHPAFWFRLRCDGAIDVGVDWNGNSCGFVAGFDVFPRQVPGGWIRSLSEYEDEGETREIRPSRAEVWRRDGFEVLLRWLNEDVATATHVELSGTPDRMTDACLMRDGEALFGCELLCPADGKSHFTPLLIPLRMG